MQGGSRSLTPGRRRKLRRRRRRRANPPIEVRRRRRLARRPTCSPWWSRATLEILAFEGGMPDEYRFTRRFEGSALVYSGSVIVPDINVERRIAVVLRGPPSTTRPVVMADGPTRSRHRFRWARPTSLCIWFGADAPVLQWTPRDRLCGLIDMARLHLLKEYWWRATGTWESPEVHRESRRSSERGRRARYTASGIATRERCWCGRGRYSQCHGRLPDDEEKSLLGLD